MQHHVKKPEAREVLRYQMPLDLSVNYEGTSEEIPIPSPDVSTRGMFIPTSRIFPVGSVLKIRFRLPRSNFQVNVRAEVRHCSPGGVGVEFLDLSNEASLAIQKEIGARGTAHRTPRLATAPAS